MLDSGIVHEDEPSALFERPASAAVARSFGAANLLRDGVMDVAGAPIPVDGPDGPACLAIRPEHICLCEDAEPRARVKEAVYTGAAVRVRVSAGDPRLTLAAPPGRSPPAGAMVGVDRPAEHLWPIPEANGSV